MAFHFLVKFYKPWCFSHLAMSVYWRCENPLVEVGSKSPKTSTIWGGSVPLEDPSFLVVQRCGEAWEAALCVYFPGWTKHSGTWQRKGTMFQRWYILKCERFYSISMLVVPESKPSHANFFGLRIILLPKKHLLTPTLVESTCGCYETLYVKHEFFENWFIAMSTHSTFMSNAFF